jgi:hypothetical protein
MLHLLARIGPTRPPELSAHLLRAPSGNVSTGAQTRQGVPYHADVVAVQ